MDNSLPYNNYMNNFIGTNNSLANENYYVNSAYNEEGTVASKNNASFHSPLENQYLSSNFHQSSSSNLHNINNVLHMNDNNDSFHHHDVLDISQLNHIIGNEEYLKTISLRPISPTNILNDLKKSVLDNYKQYELPHSTDRKSVV